MEAPDEVVDELYGVPFDEFIAVRDARAKELRKEKRREEADAVKALRKPALSAWVVNQLVRRDRDAVDGLLAAGAALRQARGGDTLRDATHEEREAVEALATRAAELLREAGKAVTDKTTAELRDTLHAAALDDEARDLLDRGRLVEPRQAIGLGGFALAPSGAEEEDEAPKKPPKKGKAAKKKAKAPKEAKDDKKAKAQEEKRRKRAAAAREAFQKAEAELRDLERERDEVEEALGAVQRAVDKARGEVERRREALED